MAESFDIAIVGAGIAGASLALALRDTSLRVALIEAQPLADRRLPEPNYDVDSFDRRVSALTPRSREFLQGLGVWDAVLAHRYCPYQHMTVWDDQGTGQIEFDASEVDADALGFIVENRNLVGALLDEVRRAGVVTVVDGEALEACVAQAGGYALRLASGRELEVQLVVAADGALSPVRQMLDVATREWDYGHRAIVATVETECSHQETAWQSFSPDGPLALLPLPGEAGRHFCSIVWSQRDAAAQRLLAMEDKVFCAALTRASEQRLGDVLASSARIAFPLRQRHAIDYVRPGVALIGDAAHTIHPLAGQGINLGLGDVASLADALRWSQRQGVGVGELAVLSRYQRERKGDNLLMMAAMDGFKRLFEQPALPVRWLRNVGMRGVNGALPLKRQLMRHAMGVGGAN